MKVSEAMTRGVVSCGLEARLHQAAKLMALHRCHCLPVLDHGQVTGVLTDRDVWTALKQHPSAMASLRVGDVMSRQVALIGPAEPIEASMRLMQRRHCRRLPVVDGAGELVGILSLDDLARRMGAAIDRERSLFEETLRLLKGKGGGNPMEIAHAPAHA